MLRIVTITYKSYNSAATSAPHVSPRRTSSGDLGVLHKVDARGERDKHLWIFTKKNCSRYSNYLLVLLTWFYINNSTKYIELRKEV